MKADLKDGFLFVLGITIMGLIYSIVYNKVYGVEGLWNPFAGIKNIFVKLVNGFNGILIFFCYLKEVFKWVGSTVVCTFAVFSPLYCPIVRIIDIVIAFIGAFIGALFRLFGLGLVVDAFINGVNGIDRITNEYYGFKITDWHTTFGVDKKCYWCKFKPFPVQKK
jgi:phage-related protein